MDKRFVGNYIITGTIKLVTGLHIGGVKETVEIGGTDNPVIYGYHITEDGKGEKVPIIPGSSIKGKMRSLLDMKYAKDLRDGKVMNIRYPEEGYGSLIKDVFGASANPSDNIFRRTRLLVRDAMPTEDTIALWNKRPELLHGVEIKGENTINRITSAAMPRFFERVPAESGFKFEAIMTVYQGDDKGEMLNLLFEGMKMLEDSYVGGHGSRGYGKVKFENIKVALRTKEYYETVKEENTIIETENIDEAKEAINKLS